MPRLITRHANRKLYDPTAKRYVSLADIVDLVVAGESVRVVEHPGGLDATPRILAQALVDLVKRRARSLPGGLMETLLRLAGGAKIPQGEVAPIKDLAERARREAEAIAARLVARGRLGIEEALHLRKEVETAIHNGVQAAESAARSPMPALQPGRAVRTIASLARELKALETIVAAPGAASSQAAARSTRAARKSSSRKPRS
ncbi:MAG: polyhydroxyalkanoate synthesis regulator DNA-binding domain-containing protein [Vicinamibacteria bacterium]|nr:polyhydroxyalkanoate synthesis regulator DNA-binding domain-containing protein [Vicinamibacteria bacterium]